MPDPAHDPIRCPECRQRMTSGHVAVSQGLHWMRRAEGPYGDFAENIPGTHSVLRANRLPAWRCSACQLITFRFGHDVQRQEAIRRGTTPVSPSDWGTSGSPPLA
ncbi:MAG: PF20097 family protein [Planctomycetota bacterium]